MTRSTRVSITATVVVAICGLWAQLAMGQSASSSGSPAYPPSFWTTLVEKNPGIGTVFISAVVSGFLVPVIMLYLNNRQTRQIKQLDAQIDIEKSDAKRRQDETASRESQKLEYESAIHACLVKILFGVQQLHVELSGTCVDHKCIDTAVSHFQKTLSEYQTIIAEKQLLLNATLTNAIYGYYATVSELLIELREMSRGENLDLAIVSVYQHATALADHIVSIQSEILKRRNELQNNLRPADFDKMRSCCGSRPDPQLVRRYQNALKEIHRNPSSEIDHDTYSLTTTTTTSPGA